MTSLTEKDKRTLRFGAIALVLYLFLFYGVKFVKRLEAERADYQQLTQDAALLKQQLETYESKQLVLAKLKGDSSGDLLAIPKASLVAKASEAIQQAGVSGGVKIGSIREAPGSSSSGEITAMRLEGVGQVKSILTFLHQIHELGYPLIIDSIQLKPNSKQPGMIQLDLDLVLLDFEKWSQQQQRRPNDA